MAASWLPSRRRAIAGISPRRSPRRRGPDFHEGAGGGAGRYANPGTHAQRRDAPARALTLDGGRGMSADPIRILIADDHTLFREGMRALLASIPDIEVGGEATSGEEVVALAASLQP